MKKTIATLLVLCTLSGVTQNLVNNHSFENYTACPPSYSEYSNNYLTLANGWDYYYPTPDFFHVCGNQEVSVPSNFIGYQLPATGNGYAGFVAFSKIFNASDVREGITSQLLDTMEVGKTYYCSFKVSLSEHSDFAVNNLGMNFYTRSRKSQGVIGIPNFSHFYDTTIISDTSNWIQVSGSFLADSNYQFFSIANHFNDSHTDTIHIKTKKSFNMVAYYYIDDICVSQDSSTCGVFPTSTIEISKNKNIRLYPNPVSNYVYLELEDFKEVNSIKIYTLTGILLKQIQKISSNFVEIELKSIPSGIYLMVLESNDKMLTKKIIKK